MTSAAARAEVTGGPARAPRPSLGRRLAPPLLLGAGAVLGALLAQAVFDPFRQDVPLCLVYHLTGLYCPGCGLTRSVHALLEGDLALALRNNALILVLLPAALATWMRWTVHAARGIRSAWMPPAWTVAAGVGAAVLFAVLRNLPAFWYLAPTSLIGA